LERVSFGVAGSVLVCDQFQIKSSSPKSPTEAKGIRICCKSVFRTSLGRPGWESARGRAPMSPVSDSAFLGSVVWPGLSGEGV
jgi:hypothetical protein